MDAKFDSRIARLIRRSRVASWLYRSQTIAFFALSIAVALLLVDRILFELDLRDGYAGTTGFVGGMMSGVLAAALVVGAIGGRRLGVADILAVVDRRAGTRELISTAFEAAPESRFRAVLRREALLQLERIDPRRVFPWPATAYLAYLVPVLLTGSVLVAFPGETLHPPRADFSADPIEGASPLRVAFRSLASGHISSLKWSYGDGADESDLDEPVHVYDRPGRYLAVLEARGPRGADRMTREIRVFPPGYVTGAFRLHPTKGVAPLSVRTENLSRNAGRFRWEFGDGSTSAEREPVHRYEAPGRYAVRLFAEGAASHAEARVEVLAADHPFAEFRAHPVEGEAPLQVRFENRSMGKAETYEWDFGDPYAAALDRSIDENSTHLYAVPGVYTVKLRARGPSGEDVEEKRHYIRVTRRGAGGGGGGESTPKDESREGEGGGRPKVEFDPKSVEPVTRDGPWVEKTKTVYTEKEGGTTPEDRYREIYPEYRRQAEESIERERIPASARDFIRRYFEGLRPK